MPENIETWPGNWAEMGGYALYVWPAYGIAALALAWLAAVSLRRWRRARARARNAE